MPARVKWVNRQKTSNQAKSTQVQKEEDASNEAGNKETPSTIIPKGERVRARSQCNALLHCTNHRFIHPSVRWVSVAINLWNSHQPTNYASSDRQTDGQTEWRSNTCSYVLRCSVKTTRDMQECMEQQQKSFFTFRNFKRNQFSFILLTFEIPQHCSDHRHREDTPSSWYTTPPPRQPFIDFSINFYLESSGSY